MAELRTYSFIDILQPQYAAFVATTGRGYLPVERQAALYVEVAPGIEINRLTDVALKATGVQPAIQVVERAYGLLEVHHFDQGDVRAAGDAILERAGLKETDRVAPKIISREIITGIDGHQAMLVNRMRHGQLLIEGETLYVLECQPAGYAALAANEAEKAANVSLLEVISFGAFGRLYLGGSEEEIAQFAAAVECVLASVKGREVTK